MSFERNDAKAETPILWPPHAKSWLIWKDSDAGRDWGLGEGDDRGWDGWMASRTRWTWVWVNSRRWWWTGRPGMLQFMGSQRVGHDWATELNWTELNVWVSFIVDSLELPRYTIIVYEIEKNFLICYHSYCYLLLSQVLTVLIVISYLVALANISRVLSSNSISGHPYLVPHLRNASSISLLNKIKALVLRYKKFIMLRK